MQRSFRRGAASQPTPGQGQAEGLEQQVEVAQQVAKKQMTVRQTEQLVKKCLAPQNEQKGQQEDTEAEQMSHKLSQLLDAKVSLTRSANGKAKLTISLDEPHKLDQLIAKLEA